MSEIILEEQNPFTEIPCNTCKWNYGSLKCQAFPEGIPEVIWRGFDKHDKPLTIQDNDLVYERA